MYGKYRVHTITKRLGSHAVAFLIFCFTAVKGDSQVMGKVRRWTVVVIEELVVKGI